MISIDKLKRQGAKQGGANASGGLGGVYKDELDNSTYLVKKEGDITANICEFLGSRIFAATSEGHGAEVSLAASSGSYLPSEKGADIYVASKFFDHYSDLYKDIDEYAGTPKAFRKDGRPLFAGTLEVFTGYLSKAFKQEKYQDFAKVAATSLLIGDFDIHTGNIGVVREPGKDPRLVRIDFGRAFDAFGANVNPESFMEHLPGLGPTNHFREFPIHLRQNKEFVDELKRVSKIDMTESINDSVDQLAQAYGPTALKEFMSKKLGLNKEEINQIVNQNAKLIGQEGVDETEILKNTLKMQLISRLKARQMCLESYANELTSRGLYAQNEKGEWVKKENKLVESLTSKPAPRTTIISAARKRVGKFLSRKGDRSL